MKFGSRLRRLRSSQGLTQVNLADTSELGRTTIVRYENGNTAPRIRELLKLAKGLNTTASELLEGVDA